MSPDMIEGSEKLLSDVEIRRLRIGSYEEHISEAASVARALMGEKPFHLVATREKDAVLFSDGKFLRMELRESGPTLSELDVETFDQTSRPNLVSREALATVDLFLRGDVQAAVTRLETLVPMVRSSGDPVEKIESQMVAPRMWRRWFSARGDQFVEFLQESGEVAGEVQLHPNFERLYDGPIEGAELIIYAARITEGLNAVLDRLERTQKAVEEALETTRGSLTESSESVVHLFADFASDLRDDLHSLHEVTLQTIEAVDDVSLRGRLCDTLVRGLRDRETATRFVVAVASRMVEAS